MQSFIFCMFLYQDHVELFLIILWHSAHKPMFVSFIYWDLGNTNLIWSKSERKLGRSPTLNDSLTESTERQPWFLEQRVLRMFKVIESWVYIYKNEKHWEKKKTINIQPGLKF